MQPRRYMWAAAAAVTLLIAAGMWMWQHNSQVAPGSAPVALTIPDNSPKAGTPSPEVTPAAKPVEAVAVAEVPKRIKRKARRKAVPVVTAEMKDPEKAKEEILAAFALISSKLRRGSREAEKGLREVEHMDIIKPLPGQGG